MTIEFKSDLRNLANTIKEKSTITGNVAVAQASVVQDVLASAGLTAEQVKAVNSVNSLVANAGILAAGEMAHGHFTATPTDKNFSLTIPGVGRDSFDVNIKASSVVTIPANKNTGAPAREEERALVVGSQRWTHHGDRTAAEYNDVKKHLNQTGVELLAILAKNNEG
jgi:hypothetical protein